MYRGLVIALVGASLLVGVWCLVAAGRDRWLGRGQLGGIAVVELALLAQAVVAAVRLWSGQRPEELVTFLGYLVSSVLTLPAAGVLSAMERTRWGSVIAGVGALVVAVLELRLIQVWTPLR